MHGTKFFILILLIWNYSHSYSSNYYFSSSDGNDERTAEEAQHPSSPWRSLNKLNELIPKLNPGDSVLFRSGDFFYGTIDLKKSGTPEKPIVFSQYGDGAAPVITGFTRLEYWKKSAPGIYFANTPPAIAPINVLTLDGRPMAMGRFPNQTENNGGYLIPDEIIGKNQIRYRSFRNEEQWNGAELVIRKNHWIMDKEKIISHESNTLTFIPSSSYEPKNGYGFFIQNHLNTLDQKGEWYHDVDADRLYICLGDETPEDLSIKVSTQANLITTLTNTRHIVFQGIHFEGANKDAVLIRGGDSFHFNSVTIKNSGENGLLVQNMDRFRFENSTILHAQNSGIYLKSGNYQATIRNTTIDNTHIFPGMGQSGDNNGYAIFSISDADSITNNTIRNSGYVGIGFRGSNVLVKNNYIDGFCLVKGDGGGIYTYTGGSRKQYTNRKIIGNIVKNGIGAKEGTSLQGADFPAPAEGIYLDDDAANILVAENTVSDIAHKGIYLHNAQNIEVRNNLVYDASFLVFLADDELGQSIKDVKIIKNTLIRKEPHQIGMGIRSTKADYGLMGLSDHNLYVDLTGLGISFFEQDINTKVEKHQTLADWSKTTNWETSTRQVDYSLQNHLREQYPTSPGDNNFSNLTERMYCSKGCGITKMKEDVFSISCESEIAYLKIDLGPIDSGAKYLASITGSADEPTIVEVFLRERGTPYQKLANSRIISFKRTIEKFQFPLLEAKGDEDASIILNIFGPNKKIRIKEVKIELLARKPKPDSGEAFRLISNPASTTKKFELKGTYKNLSGTLQSGSLMLTPYESVFLIRQ
ncbi:parallel beta-helix repeat (two copies) [Cyclobacterium lianum]|uniref:Parallel beta-helix repeat (Two copies) n=1 Tax=Cyclobacterium lianum TaxID=388280 RepID=A0A1M7NGE8_9BACT|nr:right-handed parallel beta-helix repeat-containing protein [Cyclobacterium lianum]SHN02754.1 parallel beta-helix repeat (two copies) [Cyclobacterium lianum]